MSNFLEVFFMFVILATTDGETVRAPVEKPIFYDAQSCVDTVDKIWNTVKRKHPRLRGILCYSIDEAYSKRRVEK